MSGYRKAPKSPELLLKGQAARMRNVAARRRAEAERYDARAAELEAAWEAFLADLEAGKATARAS